MNPAEILEKAEGAGVTIAVSPAGGIKVSGNQERVNQLLPIIRDNKAELIQFLLQPFVEPDHPKPFIINSELRIPGNCELKYKWWAGGQSIFDILLELGAPDSVIVKYIDPILTAEAWRRWQRIKKNRANHKDILNKKTRSQYDE